MNDMRLTQIVEEMINELSPETLGSYIKKASKDRTAAAAHVAGRRPSASQMKQDDKLLATDRKKLRPHERKKHDTLSGERERKRTKGIETATDKLVAGAGPKVKNPKTGEEILATTAYKAGPSHPAYAVAKTALKKEILIRKKINENTMIRLTNLLMENAENRVNLMKIQTIMEKLYPELTDTQSKKLMELCTEVHMMASQMNTIPYIRTETNLVEWTLLVTAFKAKVNELKEEVVKVCEDKKIDCTTVVKALDEVLTY